MLTFQTRIEREESFGFVTIDIVALDDLGKEVGHVSGFVRDAFPTVAYVQASYLQEKYQHQGHGKEMYKRFLDVATTMGVKYVESSRVLSAAAQGVWRSLHRDFPEKITSEGPSSNPWWRYTARRTNIRSYQRRNHG